MLKGIFSKIGDWVGVSNVIGQLEARSRAEQLISLERFAEHAKSVAKDHIESQDLPWEPLNEAYKERKEAQGFSGGTWIRKGDLEQNIDGWVDDDTAYVGIPIGTVNSSGGDLSEISKLVENGDPRRDIPARPLFEPSYHESLEWHINNNLPERGLLNWLMRK